MRITRQPLAIGVGLSAGLAPLAYPLFLRRRCLTAARVPVDRASPADLMQLATDVGPA